MDVTFTDRGFELEVVGGLPGGMSGCVRLVFPTAFLIEAVFAFICFGVVIEGDGLSGGICAIASLCVVGTILGAVLWNRATSPTPGRLVLDGDSLTFTAVDGEVTMSLADIKAVDVVPVGLAIRPKKGMTHHVMMVETSDKARRWLDNAIEDARRRYGTADEVPEELDALKKR